MSRFVFLALVFASSVAIGGDPYPISTVILEGDNVAGVGAVEFIDNLAINNDGDWIVEVNTNFSKTDADSVLLKNGTIFLREGMDLTDPSGATIGSFDSVNLSDNSRSGMNLFLDQLPGDEDSGIFLDDQLLIQESDISTAPELSAGTPFIGFFDSKINNNDKIMLVASIDDPAIASTVDRAIMIVDGASQTVIAKEGDVLMNQDFPVQDFETGPHQSAFNDNDQVLYIAELDESTANDHALYLNQQLLAQEGSPSPIAGRVYDFIASRTNDLNNNGDYVFKANLDGDTTTDDVIIKNNTVFAQEGDPAPGGFAISDFGLNSGPVCISDSGDVLYFAEWDDPNEDVNSGLFLNDTLLVQEGVTMIGGALVESVNSGQDAFCISNNGQWIMFEAVLANSVSGAFIIEVTPTGGSVPPNSIDVFRGIQLSGTLADAAESDDQRLHFNPGFTINSSEAPVWLIFDSVLPNDAPSTLELVVESQAGTPGLEATTEAFNWTTATYDIVDISDSQFNVDAIVTADLTAGISDHVESGTGAVRARVGWRKVAFTINFPWEVRLDQVVWNFQ